ncbi:Swr1p complex component [Paecilomyces variotii No. 5]|uniref:SWR1-complex protein 5 n=1 Tax=Byssochlamys spectabilis (strain No. 5 / NBRC 109023) TaxID=1356009 RepID=V5F776_BYSSN|nr:Swr1p complex component [Paecilomyces variotii No. 5]
MPTAAATADPAENHLDLENDEEYNSEEDEDFQVDDAGQDVSEESSEEEEQEAGGRPAKRRKVGAGKAAKTDEMELDSGDEAMIQKAKERKKKNKKKGKKGADEDEEDIDLDEDEEGGEGGFVKTRSMRMKIQEERRPLAKIDGATVDVDALWEKMNQPDTDVGLLPTQKTQEPDFTPVEEEKKESPNLEAEAAQQKATMLPSEEMIKIKRTYKFAGEMITEEKLVPKDSAEARLFLSNEGKDNAETVIDVDDAEAKKAAVKLRRPLRKYSRFDPNPPGFIKKSWEKQPSGDVTGENTDSKGPKLNTVEKSRLDWAAYVDQAGIKDELNVHSRAKEGYLGRMDFLDRMEAKREEERRNARLKGL